MFRRTLILVSFVLFILSSCASSGTSVKTASLVRYGAGSADESPAVQVSGSAAAPVEKTARAEPQAKKTDAPAIDAAAEHKKLVDAAFEQAASSELSLDAALSAFDLPAALASADQALALYAPHPECAAAASSVRTRVKDALSAVRLSAVESPAETVAGTAFKKSFRIQAVRLAGTESLPLAAFPVKILMEGNGHDSALDADSASVSPAYATGSDGILSFQAPVPQKAGKNSLVFSAGFACSDAELSSFIAGLAESGPLSVSLPHTVSTNAKKHSTTISILDYDKNGKPIRSSNPSATALLKPLVQKGFGRIGMADFPDQIASGDSAVLFKAAKNLFGSSVRRFIWGTVKIASLEQGADGLWTCVLAADIAVQDFVDNAEAFSATLEGSAAGKTEAAAITAARAKLAGELLVDALCYGM